jgi:hypothetical protein
MTNFWHRTLNRMIPRHGAGLFGVGSALSASLYISVLFAEIVSTFIESNSVSMIETLITFVTTPTIEGAITILIFSVLWIFLGAIALAGGCRYLIGCVDPKHIAQRTFFNGIRYYWVKMLRYTVFLTFGGLFFLMLFWILWQLIAGMVGVFVVLIIVLFVILATAFWSKLAFTPYFMVSGMGLFPSIVKSWGATNKRIWSTTILRLCLVIFISMPVMFRFTIEPEVMVPSLSVWPFVALIVFGYIELIVVRGYQEWQEKEKLPMVSSKFVKSDVQILDIYDSNVNGPRSMEY